jgi:NifB/MoaA-like Fe-S oxidoreductase
VSEPTETPLTSTPDQQPRPQQGQLQIDDSKILALYANFCRVTGTPEELIIDFGLNPQPFEVPTTPIPVTQRIITNFYTAKRMLHALAMTIERHEATFGVLEVNVERRVRPGVGGPR